MKYIKKFNNSSEYEEYALGDMILPNVSYCSDNHKVYYNPLPIGHEYVDLGLPSGTLWAKCNVGANSETDYGLYFAWGETVGYAADQISTDQARFSRGYYSLSDDDSSTFTKYNSNDGKTVLDLEDDAAHVNMGGAWHMPTKEQCDELLNTTYVTNAWVTNYNGSGINGRLFTSVNNGNTMFIPAAGTYDEGKNFSINKSCEVWTSTLGSDDYYSTAYILYSSDDYTGVEAELGDDRFYGKSVRGVILPDILR